MNLREYFRNSINNAFILTNQIIPKLTGKYSSGRTMREGDKMMWCYLSNGETVSLCDEEIEEYGKIYCFDRFHLGNPAFWVVLKKKVETQIKLF